MKKGFNRISGLEGVQVEERKPHETRRYIRPEKQAQPERPKFGPPDRRAKYFYQPSMANRCAVCFKVLPPEELVFMCGGGTQGHKSYKICKFCQ